MRGEILITPRGKGRPRFFRGHAYTDSETRAYEKRIADELRTNCGKPIETACRLRLVFRLPVPASWTQKRKQEAFVGKQAATCKPDIDNLVKAFMDAALGVMYTDDKLVTEITARKVYAEAPGILWEVVEND